MAVLIHESLNHSWRFQVADELIILSIHGEVMDEVEAEFIELVLGLMPRYPKRPVLIDLSECRNIASTAMGFLVRYHRCCFDLACHVYAIWPAGRIDDLLRILGLHELLEAVPDRAALERRLNQSAG